MTCRCDRPLFCACLSGTCSCSPGACACANTEEELLKRAATPMRIWRRRVKGFVLPRNTVCVNRGTPYGNPFVVDPEKEPGSACGPAYRGRFYVPTVEDAIACFAEHVEQGADAAGLVVPLRALILKNLPGKNLACFCRLCPLHEDGRVLGMECADCEPCHVDWMLPFIARGGAHG